MVTPSFNVAQLLATRGIPRREVHVSFEDLKCQGGLRHFRRRLVRSVFSERPGDEELTSAQAMCRRVPAGCDDRHIRLGIFLVAHSCRES